LAYGTEVPIPYNLQPVLVVRLWTIMRFALFLSAITLLHAQGTPPKTKASDYPVHAEMGTVTLAAEYLVHSLPTPKGNLIATDYLIVEAAFFGPSLSRLKMSPNDFSLRINGKGEPLSTELPGMVARSIRYPGARSHLEASGSVGAGDGTISAGPRPPPSQFPGDGNERTSTGPPTTVKSVEEEAAIEYRVQNATLPEGENSLPRSGLLYFYFRGKIKNIHTLELFYDGPMGKSTLKLLP
jgi:hypothetical protein